MATPGAWIDAYMEELKKAGVKGMILEAAKYETISKLAYDPWNSAVASASNVDSNKRVRFDAPPSQLVGDDAEKKIKEMVDAGKWQEVTADSKRANTGEYITKYGPHRIVIMKFIIDGTERSTFDWKETIKQAGYFHYSGSDRSGWTPFELPGGKKGQGKEVKDQAELERYWEVKEFDTAKPNVDGTMWIFRGNAFSVSSGACEWGPRGPAGPKWGSAFVGD